MPGTSLRQLDKRLSPDARLHSVNGAGHHEAGAGAEESEGSTAGAASFGVAGEFDERAHRRVGAQRSLEEENHFIEHCAEERVYLFKLLKKELV